MRNRDWRESGSDEVVKTTDAWSNVDTLFSTLSLECGRNCIILQSAVSTGGVSGL